MKTCQCCGVVSDGPACPACGEASWAVSAAAPAKPDIIPAPPKAEPVAHPSGRDHKRGNR